MTAPRPRTPLRSSTFVAIGAVGLVVLVVAAVLLAHRRTLPAAFDAAGTSTTVSSSTGVPTAAPSTASAAPTSSPAPTPPAIGEPSSVRLAAFDVRAPVVPVLSTAGTLNPPDDPGQVGWWLASAPPGSTTGTTVLVGHVDGPSGPGAFYRLVHTHAGDVVTVADSNGHDTSFEVTSLQYVTKASGLPANLFTQSGPPRLVLVSCGGSFDRSTDEYADNVVVTAVPR